MELIDLNHEQRLGLVALIEATVAADRRATDEEADILAGIVAEFGDETYRKLAAEVDRRFASEDELKQFLSQLPGDEARELIFGTVLDLAMADVVSGHESPLIQWLADTWQIDASFAPPDSAETA